jgi:hypothetical protein
VHPPTRTVVEWPPARSGNWLLSCHSRAGLGSTSLPSSACGGEKLPANAAGYVARHGDGTTPGGSSRGWDHLGEPLAVLPLPQCTSFTPACVFRIRSTGDEHGRDRAEFRAPNVPHPADKFLRKGTRAPSPGP